VQVVPGFSSFKLVAPFLQSGEVGPCLVRCTWFPSRLPLEGTRSYQIRLGHNRWPIVPEVQDPDKCTCAEAIGHGAHDDSVDYGDYHVGITC
jgi:hypothetical protein